jgi:hypothetical protein
MEKCLYYADFDGWLEGYVVERLKIYSITFVKVCNAKNGKQCILNEWKVKPL